MRREGYGPISFAEFSHRGMDSDEWRKLLDWWIESLESQQKGVLLALRLLKHDNTMTPAEMIEAAGALKREMECGVLAKMADSQASAPASESPQP